MIMFAVMFALGWILIENDEKYIPLKTKTNYTEGKNFENIFN